MARPKHRPENREVKEEGRCPFCSGTLALHCKGCGWIKCIDCKAFGREDRMVEKPKEPE